MPIEIRELVIRTVVGESAGASSVGDAGVGAAAAGGSASPEEIVQECVRQVLRVLKIDKER